MAARGSIAAVYGRVWVRRIAALVALSLMVSLLQVPWFAPEALAAPAQPVCPASRPDRWSASVTARVCGDRVEVADLLSETTRVWAEPNGTFTADQAAGMARFQRDGQWVDVNLNLQRRADGSLAPVAHPDGLQLSGAAGAGVQPLATVGSDDQRVTLSWLGALPEPVIDGSKAVYPNVMLGVDLVVEVTRTGFEQSLLVKGRAGLPFVQDIQMRLRLIGQQSEVDEHGGLALKDSTGRMVRRVAPAMMWDAVTDGISTDPVNVEPVPMTLGAAQSDGNRAMVLAPDTGWLWDPARRFPITIDPYIFVNAGFDTYVRTGETGDLSGSTKLALGTSNSGVTKRIAYVNFTGAGMAGARFNWATLKLWATVSGGTCANSTWSVFGTMTNASTSTRWSSRPNLLDAYGNNVGQDGSGNSGGAPGDVPFGGSVQPASCTGGWVEANATGLFQYATDHGWGDFTAALAPYWDDTNVYYKEFHSKDSGTLPHVSLNYSWPPAVSSVSTVPNTTCVTGAGRPKINTATPTLRAVVDDDESPTVSAKFEWWNVGGAQIGSATVSGADASTITTAVPAGALSNGGNYMWRVRGNDGAWDGAFTTCEFTVDTAAPAAPGVSSSSHPSQTGWYTATTFTGTLSASDSSGVAGYAVAVDGSASTVPAATLTQTGAAVSLAGQPQGIRYLHVRAQDNAGNWSATTHYQFHIDTTSPGAPTGLASSTHLVPTNVYNSPTITAAWTAPTDLSGIAQYAVKVDQSASTIPATTDGLQSSTTTTKTVTSDGVWYLHVRAKDNAGNWSSSAAHLTFQVDTAAPAAPVVSSSSHPDQNSAYTSGEFTGSWTSPAGGAAGYSVIVDSIPATVPATTVSTTGTTHTQTVTEGTWYLHVRAKDAAGNWGATTHYRLVVDATAPAPPTASSTDFPANQWADKLNQEGVITFSPNGSADVVTFRYRLDGGAWIDAAATPGQPLGVSIVNSADGPHTITVKALDLAGNTSPETSYTFFIGAAAGSLTGPVTGDITAARTVLRATGHSSTSAVVYEWRRADTNTWITIAASDVTYSAGGGAVTWPVATSSGGGAYPELNWDVAKTINDAESGSDPLDGPLQVRAVFTGTGFGASPEQKFTFDKNLGTAVSAAVGPGSVNLITGNYTLSGADASAGGLAVSRVYNTRQASTPDPMFGPGWVSSVLVAEGASPFTKLEVFGTLVQIGMPDGSVLGFTATGDGTTFAPPPGIDNVTVTYSASPNTYTVADTTGNVVVFGRAGTDPAGQYRPYTVTAAASNTSAAMSWEKVSVDGLDVTRPTRVTAAAPDGVNCNTLVRGCRALTFTYATATTATSTVWGDYTGRVKEISYTAWDPATAAMATVVLARYGFDDTGRLRTVWDPRLDWTDEVLHHLAVSYGYDSDGIVSTLNPPGQEPWQLTFTTLPADSGKGRLHQVSRTALSAGTANTTIVYRVPVSGGGAPYDLSAGQTARWGQAKPPTDATAIYTPAQIPDGSQSAGTLPSSYERATITYMDANARQTNTAQPGGHIDAVWYDQWGNTVQELTAGNRKRALDTSGSDTPAQESAIAATLSGQSVFTADGERLTDTFGAEHELTLASGAVVRGRAHTAFTYDQGAPGTGGPFDLVTTQTVTARWIDGSSVVHDDDAHTNTTEYDWNLRQPTKSTVDPGGLNLATRTAYDSHGRIIKTTTPAGGSSDTTPSTRVTVYYTAAANSTDPACGDHAEWEGMPCLTRPGGQPATGAELPQTLTTYNFYGQPLAAVESISTGTLRTTTVTYDGAGRASTMNISAPGLGTALETRRNIYDPATSQNTRTQTIDGASTVTAEIVRTVDTLGRQTSYTDADGNTSTFTYDLLSRPLVVNDGKATRTYAYDGGIERRGLATSVTDSNVGLITGSYDPDGSLVGQTWPNGVNVALALNEAGAPTSLTYTQPGCPGGGACTLYTESLSSSVHGQSLTRSSTLTGQTYGYDKAGRLTSVADTVSGQCTTRIYTFDTATNRTGQTTYNPDTAGACQSTTPAGGSTWTFDSADRVNTTGYTYDALGRTLAMPGSDSAIPTGGEVTLGYYANNMAYSITQGSRTATYTLDVISNRFRHLTDNKTGTAVTKVNHYIGDNDSPVWIDEGSSTYTRMIYGLGGLIGQHTPNSGEIWMLTSLAGHVIAGMPETGYSIAYTSETNENGQPRKPADAGNRRYGWHGAAQRNADTPGGLTLMGARLYTPSTGRFLSADPVYGGSANPYEYCAGDSVSCTDTSGLVSCSRLSSWTVWSLWGRPMIRRHKIRCFLSNWETMATILGIGVLGTALAFVGALLAVIPGAQAYASGVTIAARAVQIAAGVLGFGYFWWCNQRGIWWDLILQEHRLVYWWDSWWIDWATPPLSLGCR